MKPAVAGLLALVLAAVGGPARAHRLDETLQATLVDLQPGQLRLTTRIVPGQWVAAAAIAQVDADGDGAFSPAEQQAYAARVLAAQSFTLDGRAVVPTLTAWRFPAPARVREGQGEIRIEATLALAPAAGTHVLALASPPAADTVRLVNAIAPTSPQLQVVAQRRDAGQARYELEFRSGLAAAAAAPATVDAASSLPALFRLGMRHIAEGADHLLFLLALLLPAPLVARGGFWRGTDGAGRSLARVARIVTAFTLGHSLTLGAAAIGGLVLPARPVEALIALSVLVSAAHAWRPLFPGREGRVALAFGLVHGLAFAATLDRLGLDAWSRVAGTLAFNAGIEAMQLAIVAVALPPLLLLARTRWHRPLRRAGALLAGVAAIAWLAERVAGVQTPVDAVMDALARRSPWIAAALLALALVLLWRQRRAGHSAEG
jgi:hypothetical protein